MTSEELIDRLLRAAAAKGAFATPESISWAMFGELSRTIHGAFTVPTTTLTPIMRRLLFGVGFVSGARHILAVGSYVGYASAFLAAGAAARGRLESVTALDPDTIANELARKNFSSLPQLAEVTIIDGNAPDDLDQVIKVPDLVFLDLDHPDSGKRLYVESLARLLATSSSDTVVAAHDPCVPRFAVDFDEFHSFIAEDHRLAGPWILPVDECGLTLARVISS